MNMERDLELKRGQRLTPTKTEIKKNLKRVHQNDSVRTEMMMMMMIIIMIITIIIITIIILNNKNKNVAAAAANNNNNNNNNITTTTTSIIILEIFKAPTLRLKHDQER